MTIYSVPKIDKAGFFAFIQRQPEQFRFEYVRGRVMRQMTGRTLRHVAIAKRFVDALSRRLDEKSWMVFPFDRGVDTGSTIRYPDVVVERAGADPKSLVTEVPAIVVEVLSPSSEDRDLYVKPAEYLPAPALADLIVASQDEPLCFLFIRDAQGNFPTDGIEIRGAGAEIAIPILAVSISLDEIYRGLFDTAEEARK